MSSGGKDLPATETPASGRVIDPKLQVLVIEDEPIIGIYLQDLLSDLGVEVCGLAASGRAALALAAEHRPRVALVDIGLDGELDGIAVAQAMAERHGTAIVFLSGDAEAEHDPRVTALTPIAFLVKPYFPDELEAALTRAFGAV